MASLEGKPNAGIETALHRERRTEGPRGRCCQMGRQNAPVLLSERSLATTAAVIDSDKLKTKSPPPHVIWPILSQLCTNMGIGLWGRAPKLALVKPPVQANGKLKGGAGTWAEDA